MSITPFRVGSRGEVVRRDASLSEQTLSRLIRNWGLSGARPDLTERLADLGEAGGSLSSSFSSLPAGDQAALRSSFGAPFLNELLSLSRENDAELLGEGLLSLGGRLENAGREAEAEIFYESILGLPEISERAQERLGTLRGEGSFGARFEVQSRRFFRQATDPAMLAGMGAAGLVSNALRFGVMTRLAARPASWLTRGWGARFGAATVSLAFEAPAFTAAVHGAQTVLGRPQDLSWNGLSHELASGYFMLGALRLSGGATRGFARRFAGAGSPTPAQRFGLGMWEQTGTFGAILAAHRAEQALGWRPAASGEAMAFEALATLAQFRVGSRLSAGLFGAGYHQAMREMQTRSELVIPRTRSGRGISYPPRQSQIPHFVRNDILQPAFAVSGEGIGAGPEPILPNVLQMSMRPPPKKSGGLSRPAGLAAERPGEKAAASQVSTLPSYAETLADLRALSPRSQTRRLREIYQDGRLAGLALEAEFQAQRPRIEVSEFAAARRRLQVLEQEFEEFVAAERAGTSTEPRWKKFQQWQNELYPTDSAGLGRAQQIARAMGLPNLFVFKAGGINLKARIQRDSALADYYHDLSLVRDFLRSRGLNRAEAGSEGGKLLSNLLLHGDGNCVTLSLLFAHFAGRMGRPLEIGLLPRHTFLVAKNGGAIDSVLDFGMLLSKPYLERAIAPESKPLSAQHLFTVHLLNLGKLGVDQGNHAPAESALSLARDLLPNNPRSYLQLGRLHQMRGEAEAASEHYRQVHRLHPEDMHRYNALRVQAWEHIAQGRHREAESLLRQMNDLQSSDMDVLRALKLVYERSGRPRAAEEIQNILDIMEFDLPAD